MTRTTRNIPSLRHRGQERDRERGGQEQGSVSVWLVTSTFIAIILVGLGVDLAGRVHALQVVRDAAAQAARAGGQQIQPGPVMAGQTTAADPAAAVAAAQSYLAAAGVPGTAAVTDAGTTLVVETSDYYDPQFLSIIGIGPMRVTGHGQARLVRVLQGSEH